MGAACLRNQNAFCNYPEGNQVTVVRRPESSWTWSMRRGQRKEMRCSRQRRTGVNSRGREEYQELLDQSAWASSFVKWGQYYAYLLRLLWHDWRWWHTCSAWKKAMLVILCLSPPSPSLEADPVGHVAGTLCSQRGSSLYNETRKEMLIINVRKKLIIFR